MRQHPARDQLTGNELMSRTIDLTGQRFGRLTVIRQVNKKGQALWQCLCDCGTVRKSMRASHLMSGASTSCGCRRRESLRRLKQTHGQSESPEFQAWLGAKQRCTNPKVHNYQRYGGRGITFGFPDFAKFFAEVGPRPSDKHSLDRINNAKGYEPGNVRWATMTAQCRNKGNNRMLTYQGKSQCMADWAEELGLPYSALKMRLRSGWSTEKALSAPVKRRQKSSPSRQRGRQQTDAG